MLELRKMYVITPPRKYKKIRKSELKVGNFTGLSFKQTNKSSQNYSRKSCTFKLNNKMKGKKKQRKKNGFEIFSKGFIHSGQQNSGKSHTPRKSYITNLLNSYINPYLTFMNAYERNNIYV